MKEKNADKLRDALSRLPAYDAPGSAWDAIDKGLSPTLADQLPTYQPAAGVWNAISRKMEQAEVATLQQTMAKQRQLPWRKLAGIAAAIALLLTVGIGLNSIDRPAKVTIAYHQEIAPAMTIPDWDDNEASFTNALAEIEARNEPKLNALGQELIELNEAKEEIKATLVAYGDDASVIRQLAEIERDRSDIYRQIIEL
ncbi:hypothetical protein [Neolewinella persica]|uniref:hypothetical protein n=1 Tax=Neolewinella persica TaxID=70998 RepID=UPI000365CE81|nr:hypothetical protein [Neolewinella persica]